MDESLTQEAKTSQQTLAGEQSVTGGTNPDIYKLHQDIGTLFQKTSALEKKTQENIDKSNEIKRNVENTQSIMYLGFTILLIMVVTIVIAYFQQLTLTYSNLADRVNSVQILLNTKHK